MSLSSMWTVDHKGCLTPFGELALAVVESKAS